MIINIQSRQGDSMKFVVLKWSQKVGGIQEFAFPKHHQYDASLCMNIYSLHRMRKKEPSLAHYKTEKVNQISIFSGFGEGGYGGTGGENYVGIPERVLSLTLEPKQNAKDYERIAVKIASRLFIDQENMAHRLDVMYNFIQKSGKQEDPKALLKHIDTQLDSALQLTEPQKTLAYRCEAQFCFYWITTLQEDLEEMTIRPASFAMADKSNYLEKLKEKEDMIKTLAQQVASLSQSTPGQSSADERIAQMQSDYQVIFTKMTEQIAATTEEFNMLQDSMKGLVDDLNVSLRAKMEEAKKLKLENMELRTKLGQKQ